MPVFDNRGRRMPMTKKTIYWLLPAVLLVVILAAAAGWNLLCQRQEESYGAYTALSKNILESSLTVTENGTTVGVYDLHQLGLLKQAQRDVDNCFSDLSRMMPKAFRSLPLSRQLSWRKESARLAIYPDWTDMDIEPILQDLLAIPRTDAQESYLKLQDGIYVTEPGVPGTRLDSEALEEVLRWSLICEITPQSPAQITLDLSKHDVYQTPASLEETSFDYTAQLQTDTEDLTIPIKFLNYTYKLEVAPLISVSKDGTVWLDTNALMETVSAWAKTVSPAYYPYIMDTQLSGPVNIPFIPCSYVLQIDELIDALSMQLLKLDTSMVTAPMTCTRDGKPYTLGDTYVEIDIRKQKMTYLKDGEVVVQTDVVTGYPYGHWTPTGLYAVENKLSEIWLTGWNYEVFVDYWVEIFDEYGIHDAQWRDTFGGEYYLSDGSHGCINTPLEAMKTLYDTIEVGVPVIIFDALA